MGFTRVAATLVLSYLIHQSATALPSGIFSRKHARRGDNISFVQSEMQTQADSTAWASFNGPEHLLLGDTAFKQVKEAMESDRAEKKKKKAGTKWSDDAVEKQKKWIDLDTVFPIHIVKGNETVSIGSYGEMVGLFGDYLQNRAVGRHLGYEYSPICLEHSVRDSLETSKWHADSLLKGESSLFREAEGLAEALRKGDKSARALIGRHEGDGAYWWKHKKARYEARTKELSGGSLGTMGFLASWNFDHFGVEARYAWAITHVTSLYSACIAGRAERLGHSAKARVLLQEAFAQNALGDHFLTDLFSAGHIRTPRMEIYRTFQRYGVPKDGTLVGAGVWAKCMHDEDNESGLFVTSRKKPEGWVAYGDGQLLTYQNRENRHQATEALKASLKDVVLAYETCNALVPGHSGGGGRSDGAGEEKLDELSEEEERLYADTFKGMWWETALNGEKEHYFDEQWLSEQFRFAEQDSVVDYLPDIEAVLEGTTPNPTPMFTMIDGHMYRRQLFKELKDNTQDLFHKFTLRTEAMIGAISLRGSVVSALSPFTSGAALLCMSTPPLIRAHPMTSPRNKLSTCLQQWAVKGGKTETRSIVKCHVQCGLKNDPRTGVATKEQCYNPTYTHSEVEVNEYDDIDNHLGEQPANLQQELSSPSCECIMVGENADSPNGTCMGKRYSTGYNISSSKVPKRAATFCRKRSNVLGVDCCKDPDIKAVFEKMLQHKKLVPQDDDSVKT